VMLGSILEIFKKGRAGLKPTKPKAVWKLDGALCTTPVESL